LKGFFETQKFDIQILQILEIAQTFLIRHFEQLVARLAVEAFHTSVFPWAALLDGGGFGADTRLSGILCRAALIRR
jgi:hypothetical protein